MGRVVSRFFRLLFPGLILFLFLAGLSGCSLFRPDPSALRAGRTHFMLGSSYLAQDKLQDAFLEFQKSVAADPGNKESWNMLGYVYTRLGEYEKAISHFERAVDLDPEYSEAHTNMAMTFNLMGRWSDAVRASDAALKNLLYATPEAAMNNMGYAYLMMGDPGKAIPVLKNALLRRPIPQARLNLSLAYEKAGRVREAIDELIYLVEKTPNYPDAHYHLGLLLLARGERAEAVEHLKRAVELDPEGDIGRKAAEELRNPSDR